MPNLIECAWFEDEKLFVKIGGNIYINDVNEFPNLRKGTPQQWANYTIEGQGRWLHWEELDEDLSAEGFVQVDN